MPFNCSPWPHIDVAGPPEIVRRFLLGTIVVSLYSGSIFMLVLVGMVVTEVMNIFMGTGSSEFSHLASVLGNLP
jgi:hypothetical protein